MRGWDLVVQPFGYDAAFVFMEEIMQRFFFNKRLIIVLVVLIISFVLVAFSITVRNNKATPPLVQQMGNDAAGMVDRVVAYPVNGLKGAMGSFSDLMNTYSENQRLKGQVDSLATEKVKDQTLKRENKKLKEQLKLNKTLTDYEKISASVLTRSPSAWQNQVVISKGSLSGVKKNAAVMSKKGLVGRITEVNKTNSKVELLSTTNDSANRFATQVMTKNNKVVNGLITGYNATSNYLVMGQITVKTGMEKGDKVITSGLGGNSPKGLYVGTVAKVEEDDYGLASKVYVKPAADFTDLDVVTVAKRVD
ncbi:rod shape-determining protein MreC [Liquorilactobacillus aquaticus DSM 21051]|uniref:Cell shape-determining protein MreC n=2 Tax=Liquorilactobacillus aquaticus TaxID=392566 RepID=A0A0R2D9Y4_9LACO|nr:rod shape-determining protein MreC [Liquorilactobacillus aquaticus DSM 21051]